MKLYIIKQISFKTATIERGFYTYQSNVLTGKGRHVQKRSIFSFILTKTITAKFITSSFSCFATRKNRIMQKRVIVNQNNCVVNRAE